MRLIIVFLFFSTLVNAQTENYYRVIKVSGDIMNVDQGKNLGTGDKIEGSEKLKFQSANANALAINGISEKFSLKSPSSDMISGSGGLVAVQLSATLVVSRNQLSTRGLQDDRPVLDLKSYLGKETFTVIGDSLSVLLDKDIYPLNNNKFIVFYYKIKDEQVSKKVGFNKQQLIIEKEKLMRGEENTLEGNEINAVEVYQYEQSTQLSDKITGFNLHFVPKELLMEEFNAILPVLKGNNMSTGEMQAYLVNYFNDVYGLTDKNAVYDLVDKYLASLDLSK